MIRQATHTYKGMNQDAIQDKQTFDLYYEGNNIRVITSASQSQGGISNEKGNTLIFNLPSPVIGNDGIITYGDKELNFSLTPGNELLNSSIPSNSGTQQVIGKTLTKDGFILFSTDDNGFDCIWGITEMLEGDYDLELLYCRNLGFSSDSPIQAIYNFENELIQKVYWVDGNNQLRFINIKHSIVNGDVEELIDLNSTSINIVGDYNLSQIELVSVTGGGLNTSGMVQYAYNLYKLNGSQTRISPSSDLISVDKGVNSGGGDVNEKVGRALTLRIPELDERYTHIKIYAIKYNELNQIPSISLIGDERIDSYQNYVFTDSGIKINDISLAEFLFLGSDPITPKHIESKDNRLFAASYKDDSYKLEIDCRAYSHNLTGATTLFSGNVFYDNSLTGGNQLAFSGSDPITSYNYPTYYDAINPHYEQYKYQKDGVTLGGEGLFLKYELVQKDEVDLEGSLKYLRFFKDNEIYRIGIQFYNKIGQKTEVKWIADFKTPEGNLEGKYNCLKVELKATEFNNYINSLNLDEDTKPVGYKIVRAERNIKDRTIICQGNAMGMMIQTTEQADTRYWWTKSNRNNESKKFVKTPLPISRGFATLPNERSVRELKHLETMHRGPQNSNIWEFFREPDSSRGEGFRIQFSWQYNKMYQIYSPEITFDTGISFDSGLNFKVRGIASHSTTNKYYQLLNINSKQYYGSVREENISDYTFRARRSEHFTNGNGLFGPTESGCSNNNMTHYLFNTKYTGNFIKSNFNADTPIFGIPEIAEKGQGVKFYNGNADYKYSNTLEGILADGFNDEGCCCGGCDDEGSIRGLNTWGGKSLIVVGGEANVDENVRPSLNTLQQIYGLPAINGTLMLDIVRPVSYIYNNGIYGGLSLENKSRVSYIEIGTYKKIDDTAISIESPGDTYVQVYRVGRLLKTDTEVLDCRKQQVSEIIEFKVETTVNLQNRNDLSLLDWDAKFQPRDDEFHKYNTVYSQSNSLIQNTTDNINFKNNESFETRIISSKVKTAGEVIDSWTDFLENEVIDLDGKYGPITSLVNSNDNIYTLQTFATSFLSISPRVQTQGNDGISIELGTGNVLHDYNYISTTTGCSHKWSPFVSPSGFYFIDTVNNNLIKVQGNQLNKLSINKGMNSFMQNNLNFETLKRDNPILKEGITGSYDRLHDTALFTVLQGDKSFTLSYNEKTQLFESFYDYKPSMYINRGFKLLSFDNSNNGMYEHFTGNVGEFYGQKYPSNVTMQYFTQGQDSIFNNITFRSTLSQDGNDISNKTINQIRAWNEYQDTELVNLILNKNLTRKFRLWKANIPRVKQNGNFTLDRIRGQWFKLLLQFDNELNENLVLHDTNLYYTSYFN